MRRAARNSCSGRLADDRPMSGLRLIASGDSLLNYNVAVSIVLMLLLLQMANMSNLSLCHIKRTCNRVKTIRDAILTCARKPT